MVKKNDPYFCYVINETKDGDYQTTVFIENKLNDSANEVVLYASSNCYANRNDAILWGDNIIAALQ